MYLIHPLKRGILYLGFYKALLLYRSTKTTVLNRKVTLLKHIARIQLLQSRQQVTIYTQYCSYYSQLELITLTLPVWALFSEPWEPLDWGHRQTMPLTLPLRGWITRSNKNFSSVDNITDTEDELTHTRTHAHTHTTQQHTHTHAYTHTYTHTYTQHTHTYTQHTHAYTHYTTTHTTQTHMHTHTLHNTHTCVHTTHKHAYTHYIINTAHTTQQTQHTHTNMDTHTTQQTQHTQLCSAASSLIVEYN